MRLVMIGLLSLSMLGVQAQAPEVSTSPQVRQLQDQVDRLQTLYEAEREKVNALAPVTAGLRRQMDTMEAQMVPACVQAIERGNPGKTVNPAKAFVIEDKVVK